MSKKIQLVNVDQSLASAAAQEASSASVGESNSTPTPLTQSDRKNLPQFGCNPIIPPPAAPSAAASVTNDTITNRKRERDHDLDLSRMLSDRESKVAALTKEITDLRHGTSPTLSCNTDTRNCTFEDSQTTATDELSEEMESNSDDWFRYTSDDEKEEYYEEMYDEILDKILNQLVDIEDGWKDIKEKFMMLEASKGNRVDLAEFERSYKDIYLKIAADKVEEQKAAMRQRWRSADSLAERPHIVESEDEITRFRLALPMEAEKEKEKINTSAAAATAATTVFKPNIACWINNDENSVEAQLGELIPWHFCFLNPSVSNKIALYKEKAKKVIQYVHPNFFSAIDDSAKRHNGIQLSCHLQFGITDLLLRDVYTDEERTAALRWFQVFIAYLLAIRSGKLLQRTLLDLQAEGTCIRKPPDCTTREELIGEEKAFYALLWRSLRGEIEPSSKAGMVDEDDLEEDYYH